MPVSGRVACSSGRVARRNTQSTPSEQQHHRRERTKSSQSHVQHPRRESSAQSSSSTTPTQRPGLNGRASPVPLVPQSQSQPTEDGESEDPVGVEPAEGEEIAGDPFFQRHSSIQADESDEDLHSLASADSPPSTEGKLSPTHPHARPDSIAEPLASPGLTETLEPDDGPMQEINIGVLGASGVGKSTFIKRTFDLPDPVSSLITTRRMSIDGSIYTVRLLEVAFDSLKVDEDNRISWPDTLDGTSIPWVDGAFALYDVMNQESLAQVPEILNAMHKASLPCILVSCKCDVHPAYRQVDPTVIEQRAKAYLGDVSALQTSEKSSDGQKRCMAVLLRTIVSLRQEQPKLTAARRRANSSAVRRISPRSTPAQKHNRASSEYSASMLRSQTPNAPNTDSRARTPTAVAAQSHGPGGTPQESFLDLEESPERTQKSQHETTVTSEHEQRSGNDTIPGDHELKFDQLVDRLLSQPLSKADTKYVAVFLALYRNFAAPGRLLEAITQRFEAMDRADGLPHLIRTVNRLRYLAVLENWISTYPGDFAHPTTRRKICAFIASIAGNSMFAVAARELATDLEAVVEDDDTGWAYSDQNRQRADTAQTFLSNATTLDGESSEEDMAKNMAHTSLSTNASQSTLLSPASTWSIGGPTSGSSQTMLNAVENAQRKAKLLAPTMRIPLTKIQWRALMEQSDDSIARELTRMDWIMFSSIRPRELVRHVILSAEQKKNCKSLEYVNRMIEHFNHLADWVTNFVLLRDKPKHRALMLEKFMRVARKLRELNNYNSLSALMAGINGAPVHRLLATRDLIPPAVSKDFMKLEILMGSAKSHFAYRLAWENSTGERIPYIPLHRRDLATAAQGNKTFVTGGGGGAGAEGGDGMEGNVAGSEGEERINWRKFEIMGEVIVGVQRAQQVPYPAYKVNEEIKALVLDTKIVRDEDELYERSVHLEPAAGAGDRRRFGWFQRGFA